MEKRHSLSTRSGAARFRSGEGKDRWFQPGGHLGGCVAHGGVRAAAETLQQLADTAGYREEFLKLFGFGLPGIDYEKDTEPHVVE